MPMLRMCGDLLPVTLSHELGIADMAHSTLLSTLYLIPTANKQILKSSYWYIVSLHGS